MSAPVKRVGQVWESADPRQRGRRIRIEHMDATFAYCAPFGDSTGKQRRRITVSLAALRHPPGEGRTLWRLCPEIVAQELARGAAEKLADPRPGGVEVTPVLVGWLEQFARPGLERDAIIEGVKARDALGRQKYGQPLTTGDGRSTEVEVWQELLDALQYAMKGRMQGTRVDTGRVRATLDLLLLLLDPPEA